MIQFNIKTCLFLITFITSMFTTFSFSEENTQATQQQSNKQKTHSKKINKLYRVEDAHGNISYSDIPSKNSKEIVLQENISINIKIPKITFIPIVERNDILRDPNAGYYDNLKFSAPENNGVIRNNAALVELTASVLPKLDGGHFLIFYLDGKAINKAQLSTSVTAKEIEYGPHVAYFEIVTGQGVKVQKSETIQFDLLHTVRKKALNNNKNNSGQSPFQLPQLPQITNYEAMRKTDK